MRIPTIQGIIDRRILVNFRVCPKAMQAQLPAPFRPQLIGGFAIGGICLIRLKRVRPAIIPLPIGLSSENAAHRIAVEWGGGGDVKHGVYIPRRDSNSRLNQLAGGRIFPGTHHRARFDVRETAEDYRVELTSADDESRVLVDGRVTTDWPTTSVFESKDAASQFFERGALGYSATGKSEIYDGLELQCEQWRCKALALRDVHSSYFQNTDRFPADSIEFDCALLMTDIRHRWVDRGTLCCDSTAS